MLVVGGGMFVHNIDAVHFVLAFLPSLLADLVSGLNIRPIGLKALDDRFFVSSRRNY